jgi:hypothetical protein
MIDQDGRSISSDGIERTVADRYLAVVTGQDVQSEDRNGVNQQHGRLEHPIVRNEHWEQQGNANDADERTNLPPRVERALLIRRLAGR